MARARKQIELAEQYVKLFTRVFVKQFSDLQRCLKKKKCTDTKCLLECLP